MNRFVSYDLTPEQANILGVCSFSPADMRREFLEKYQAEHGTVALIHLFSEFFGMVASVENNRRDFIELFCITDCNMHPHEVEKLNLPSILGACKGVEVARTPTPGMCGSCAFRLGTAPNQSICTTSDAQLCVEDIGGSKFMCHEFEGEEPDRPCAGYAIAYSKECKEAGFCA